MKRPSGWMDDGSGGRSQGLLHLHPQKYTGAESGVASPKAFIYRLVCALWPKATVKSPVGACIFTLYFLLPWTPCPALPLPCPAPTLPCPCPCPTLFRIYLLLPGTGGGSYTGNRQCFFFLLLPGTGRGSYTWNFSSSSSPMGGSAPLDSVTVGGGVRFDGSLVSKMDETAVQLDG